MSETAQYTGSAWVGVYLDQGGGMLAPEVQYDAIYGKPSIGDADGDGIPDIVLASSYAGAVLVLRGNGEGTFQAPVTYGVGLTPMTAAVTDLDHDGAPDMVTLSTTGPISVELGACSQ